MPTTFRRRAILASILGGLATAAVATHVFLRTRSLPMLFDEGTPLIRPIGVGKELTIGPVSATTITDSKIMAALLLLSVIGGVLAMAMSAMNFRSNRRDHFTAFGFVLGMIALSWSGLVYIGAT